MILTYLPYLKDREVKMRIRVVRKEEKSNQIGCIKDKDGDLL